MKKKLLNILYWLFIIIVIIIIFIIIQTIITFFVTLFFILYNIENESVQFQAMLYILMSIFCWVIILLIFRYIYLNK